MQTYFPCISCDKGFLPNNEKNKCFEKLDGHDLLVKNANLSLKCGDFQILINGDCGIMDILHNKNNLMKFNLKRLKEITDFYIIKINNFFTSSIENKFSNITDDNLFISFYKPHDIAYLESKHINISYIKRGFVYGKFRNNFFNDENHNQPSNITQGEKSKILNLGSVIEKIQLIPPFQNDMGSGIFIKYSNGDICENHKSKIKINIRLIKNKS